MTPTPTPPVSPAVQNTSRLQRLGGFLQIDSDNSMLLRDYAVEALQVGEFRAAAIAIERLGVKEQTTVEDELLRGRALRLDGQLVKALEALSCAAERWPDESRIALEQAATYFDQNSFEAALDVLPREPALPSVGIEIRAMRVRLMHHMGRLEDALNEAFADGERVTSPVARAVLPVLMDSARWDEAQKLAQAVLQAGSADSPAPYEVCEPLAAAALDQDDVGTARRWCDEALQRRQDDGRIWLLRGLTQMRAGDLPEAMRNISRAAALMPSHAGSQLALGWAHLAQNDLSAAQTAFDEALSISPAFSETHGSLAVVAALRRETGRAQEFIRTAQRLDRHGASAQWAQALLQGQPAPEQVTHMAREIIMRVRRQRTSDPRTS